MARDGFRANIQCAKQAHAAPLQKHVAEYMLGIWVSLSDGSLTLENMFLIFPSTFMFDLLLLPI